MSSSETVPDILPGGSGEPETQAATTTPTATPEGLNEQPAAQSSASSTQQVATHTPFTHKLLLEHVTSNVVVSRIGDDEPAMGSGRAGGSCTDHFPFHPVLRLHLRCTRAYWVGSSFRFRG